MKVADYIINRIAEDIDQVFVVYGAANGDLIDAFTRTDKTRYVAMMHEQAAGFAMEGYAKISGKYGVGIATSGPGGQNFVTPIGNCFYDSVPCLFITGQINSKFLRPEESIRQIGCQETDIVNIVKPITKYAVMIKKPEDIKYELEKCLHLMREGRPGPVLLDIPLDIQKAEINPDKLYGYNPTITNYSTSELEQFVFQYKAALSQSKRPVLLIGGGCKYQSKLLSLANKLKIPVFPTWNALDIVTSDFPYYGGRIGTYGGAGRNFGLQNSDLILSIGSRISGRITGGNLKSFARAATKFMVDIDPANTQQHLQQIPFDHTLTYDAGQFIDYLCDSLDIVSEFTQWTNQVLEWRDKYDPVKEKNLQSDSVHPYLFGHLLSEYMTKNDILVGDCGGNIVVINHSFKTKIGQKYFTNNGNSPMGFSFAGAIGAALAPHSGNVVCVIGDGGFNMNIQELQTLVNYNIPVKTFIMNNHIYGITKAFQKTNFGGRAEACGPKGYNPPNFLPIVEAYGIKTFYIDKNENLDKVIQDVLNYDGPCVCDVNCHEYHTYQPRIFGWKTPIEDMYPYLDRQEFKDNMIIEPLDGYLNPEKPQIE